MALARLAAIVGGMSIAAATFAHAADLPAPPVYYEPVPVEIGGGWYLRGDIGVSHQDMKRLTNVDLDAPVINAGNRIDFLKQTFDPAAIIGVGVGYKFNNWLRADVTGEYRAASKYSATERILQPDGSIAPNGVNYFTAKKTEFVGLFNTYLDLGTWGGMTPYIGAGIGFASVRISNFRDVNLAPGNGTIAAAPTGTRTNFAWALHAGFGYEISENLLMDVGYRYINLGRGQTGGPPRCITPCPPPTSQTPWVFNHIHSHDLRIGLRWMFHAPRAALPVYPEDPPIRKL